MPAGFNVRSSFLACALGLLSSRWQCGAATPYSSGSAATASMHSIEAEWDFEDGLQGWANKTYTEQEAEVYGIGGEMRGAVRGPSGSEYPAPHVDSPPLFVRAVDRHYIVVRMAYSGVAQSGRFVVRAGAAPPQRHDGGTGTVSGGAWNAVQAGRRCCVGAGCGAAGESLLLGGADIAAASMTLAQCKAACLYPCTAVVFYSGAAPADGSAQGRCLGFVKCSVDGGGIAASAGADVYERGPWEVATEGTRKWSNELPDFDDNNLPAFGTPQYGMQLLKLDFEVIPDGTPRIYYVPLHRHHFGLVTQLRLYPALATGSGAPGPAAGDSFAVSWVRIVKAPTVRRATGCLDKFYGSANLGYGEPGYAHAHTHLVNGFHRHYSTRHYAPPPGTFAREEASYVAPGGDALPYATTYNCDRAGGTLLTLHGINFGVAGALVNVGGAPCLNVVHTVPETELTCTLPPLAPRVADADAVALDVEVVSGAMEGLRDSMPSLSYATAPPAPPAAPTLSNIGARSVDLTWLPAMDTWDALTVTGYVITRRVAGRGSFRYAVTVGNVTHTTVIGLTPNTLYEFRVAALTEPQGADNGVLGDAAFAAAKHAPPAWRYGLDLYGRRPAVPGALLGAPSAPANATATLKYDLSFNAFGFNANATLNHSATDGRATLGPTGVWGGEGHFGLVLVGDAQVEGCNESFACCDGFVHGVGCAAQAVGCAAGGAARPSYERVQSARGAAEGVAPTGLGASDVDYAGGAAHASTGHGVRSNSAQPTMPKWSRLADSTAHANAMRIAPWELLSTAGAAASDGAGAGAGAGVPTEPCGPALRLTGSHARASGAAWYPRPLNLREGFETRFTLRAANPSVRCAVMDDTHTHCRARGADGFAFVLQGNSPSELGAGGRELGYGGITNSLAVEFDTWYNPEQLEPFENHIAVHTRGWREVSTASPCIARHSALLLSVSTQLHALACTPPSLLPCRPYLQPNSANHSYSLAHTTEIADLCDTKQGARGVHEVRIVYTPDFDEEAMMSDVFQPSPRATHFLENADFPQVSRRFPTSCADLRN